MTRCWKRLNRARTSATRGGWNACGALDIVAHGLPAALGAGIGSCWANPRPHPPALRLPGPSASGCRSAVGLIAGSWGPHGQAWALPHPAWRCSTGGREKRFIIP